MKALSSQAALKPQTTYKFNSGTTLESDFDVDYYETYFRNYDPQIGRFTGIDAMSAETMSLTTYGFASNNPVLMNDPTGMKAASPSDVFGYSPTYQQYLNSLADPMNHEFGWGGDFMSGGGGGGGDGENDATPASQVWSSILEASKGSIDDIIDGNGNSVAGVQWNFSNGYVASMITLANDYNSINLYNQYGEFNISFNQSEFQNVSSTNRGDWLKNISDKSKFPGINIYQTSLMKDGTAVTLPGLGIFISDTYQSTDLIEVEQHEYGHYLDATYGLIGGEKVSTLTKYSLFYFLIALPSINSASENPNDHKYFWTEIRANRLAYLFFGNNYILDEANYPLHEKH